MAIEIYQNEWRQRSKNLSNSEELENMIRTELYDLTWKISVNFIIKQLDLKNDQKIFEAGFGWGRLIHGIKYYLPDISIEGMELTSELHEKACRLLSENCIQNVKLHCGDILDLQNFDSDYFDAIYSSRVLHYIQDKKIALNNLYRTLKPSSKILIMIPNKYCPYRWFTYGHPLYSIIELKKIMRKTGFKNLKWGSIGYIPTFFRRFPHTSKLYLIEKLFQQIAGLDKIGGLAYITGIK